MPEPADQTGEPEWVQQLRAAGRKFRRGTDRGELPFEPGVDFRPPTCGEEMTHTEFTHTDLPVEPDWVHRLRAKGYKITTGAVGTPGLPYEPGIDFSPPESRRRALWRRVADTARRLFGPASFPRHRREGSHAAVP